MRIFTTITFFFILFTAKAQSPETFLEKINTDYSIEKLYIHYDKTDYVAGETIWYKAYIMDGYLPSTKSTVLSVELLNEEGTVLQKKVLPVIGSAAVGDFELDKKLPQGVYTVKAYTKNLMNFGIEKFYYKGITIYNPTNNVNNNLQDNTATIYFLPEGGNFVANVNNVIAFTCKDKNNMPVQAEGNIVDENGKEYAQFKTTHNGMGKVSFTPTAGMKYIANCTLGQAQKTTVVLPVLLAEGVTLQVQTNNAKTYFNVDASTVLNPNLLPAYLLAVQENVVAFKVPLTTAGKIVNAEIPVSQLPTGIVQLTVFNAENKPLAERLFFVNTGDYLPQGSFTTTKPALGKRQKNEFSYSLNDTLAGTFSVAVVAQNKNAEQEANIDNIVSRFLLTSDMRGQIYNPAYYFENNDAEHKNNLDLVMLTNGWRRYSWMEIFSNRFPSMAIKDPNYITIAGIAKDPTTGKVLPDADLNLIVKTSDKKLDFLNTVTDKEGNFNISGIIFDDTAKISFKNASTAKGKVTVTLQSYPIASSFVSAKTIPNKQSFLPLSNQKKNDINSLYAFNNLSNGKGILLDEITVYTKLASQKKKYEDKYVSGRFGSTAAKELDLLTQPTNSTSNVFEYIKSRISGVNVTGGIGNYVVNYRNRSSLQGGPIPMTIYLDEFQVEPSQIATMRIGDVALIQVYDNTLSIGAGGTLAIYTKKGAFLPPAFEADMQSIPVEGFNSAKQFFSPDYASETSNEIKTDERKTLLWSPYHEVDLENRKIDFSFYNNDNAKAYTIIIEGILADGKLLHVEKLIE